MSLYLYDEAILEKIKGWTSSTKMTVLNLGDTERLFQQIADESNDSPITLPLITISRNRNFEIVADGTTKKPMSYNGASIETITKDGYTATKSIMAIPVSIQYQLDVYTRYAKEADVLVRNLIFNLINYPAFEVEIPGAHKKHTGRITLNSSISDNSDIPTRFIAGNFTRLTLDFSVDDAYLWDVRDLRDTSIDIIIDDSQEVYQWNEDHTKVLYPDLSKDTRIEFSKYKLNNNK